MRPRTNSRNPTSVRRPASLKFGAAVGAVVLCLLSVSVIGGIGMAALRADIDRVTTEQLTTLRSVGNLALDLYSLEEGALRQIAVLGATAPDPAAAATLDLILFPRTRQSLAVARRLLAADATATRRLNEVGRDVDSLARIRQTTGAAVLTPTGRAALLTRTNALFDRMTTTVLSVRADEYAHAERSGREARATYSTIVRWLVIGSALSLLIALTVVLLLVRDLVPRLRSYARFATDFAAGHSTGRLTPRGSDELAEVGRALDRLVSATEAARQQEADQTEFADTLQVTAGEDEAHELVQRHLERSVPGSTVVVLQRNNSENRLDAATALVPGSPLAARLSGAVPRSCLALRFGRTHCEDPGRTPLLNCLLCAEDGAYSTCEPLLVGGRVIGSVLVAHQDSLAPEDEARIRNSVAQAAPVLGNLRNLALAEFRANNDSLTGLPNKRATDDTLKRMVAQANRSITPLSALMLDLDHFKQVNDRFGHAKGDEVLAAVGAAVASCMRGGDFAGRFGGEELLVLLPDTTAEGAASAAERLRTTIAAISVPGVERAITVSIGIADLIQHGGDAPGLLRSADRALYAAKATGRNRVVTAGTAEDDGAHPAARPADRPSDAGPGDRQRGAAVGAASSLATSSEAAAHSRKTPASVPDSGGETR
jgi:diguanylate cyclase (GGDEF)-like protein